MAGRKNDTSKDKFDAVLNDQERLALQMFVDNPVQVEAVKKVLLYRVYYAGVLKKDFKANPSLNFALGLAQLAEQQGLTDEVIGRRIRSAMDGVNFLEAGFDDLLYFKKAPEQKEAPENPAV